MAISSIELFKPETSVVGRMLAGGTSVFADALQNVMNVGRDMVNNQSRQEQDFQQAQRNEEAMAMRRADKLRSMFESDRAFEESTLRDRRDFGFREGQAEAAENRYETDLDFRKDQAERTATYRDKELGYRDKAFDLQKEDNELARDKFDLDKAEIERTRQFNEDILAPEYGPKLPTQNTPEVLFADAEMDAKAALELKNGPAYEEARRRMAAAKAAGGSTGTDSRAQERLEIAKRNEQRQVEEAEAKKIEADAKALVDDRTAFAPQTQFVTPEDITKGTPAARAADAWDKDRFGSERATATSFSKDEYVSKGGPGLSPKQKAKRAEFWDLTNGKASEASYGNRPDGSAKGSGWLGELKLPDGGVATEYTMQSQAVQKDGKQVDFPTLVPTLTPAEVDLMVTDIIPNKKPIPEAIIQKAIAHAKSRLAKGESLFAPKASKSAASSFVDDFSVPD